jgi:hypothetical protein
MAPHEILRKGFAGLELGGEAARAENGAAASAEQIGNAPRERSFGADDGQVGTLVLGQCQDSLRIGRIDPGYRELPRDAGVPGCTEHTVDARLRGQLETKDMFAGTAAHYQNPHVINWGGKG